MHARWPLLLLFSSLLALLAGCSLLDRSSTHRLDSRAMGSDPYVKSLGNDGKTYRYEAFDIYQLSDADSKDTARQQALEKAKALAAREFAREVTPELRLNNSAVTRKRVQIYSMAFLEADIRRTRFYQINEQGFLKTAIVATINKEPLIKHLEDIFKSELVNNLEKENTQLQSQLENLEDQLRDSENSVELESLIKKRSSLQLELAKNLRQFKVLVEESKLIDQAIEKLDRLEQHKQTLHFDLYDEIKLTMNIELGKPYVYKRSRMHAERSFIAMSYKWEYEPTAVSQILESYYSNKEVIPQDFFLGGDLMRKETLAYYSRRIDYETLNPGIEKLLRSTTLGVKIHLGIPGTSTYLKLLQCNEDNCRFYYKREGTLIFEVSNSEIYKVYRGYKRVGNFHKHFIEQDGEIPESFYY